MEVALKNIQSKLSTSNIVQELFSSFAARWASNYSACSLFYTRTSFSHKAILEMEIQLLREKFTEKDPKLIMEQIQRMASEGTSFIPTTLGLVYDKLLEDALSASTPNVTSSSTPNVTSSSTPDVTSSSTPSVASPSTFGVISPSAFGITSSCTFGIVPSYLHAAPISRLRCARCCCITSVYNLYDGLYCPQCPATGRNGKNQRGRPFMRCTNCDALRVRGGNVCLNSKCGEQFA